MTDVATPEEQLVRERIAKLLTDHDPKGSEPREFWGAQFDLGLAWVHFPEGRGGLGVSPKLQGIVRQELRAAGAPDNVSRNVIGLGMGGPVIVTHGTEEQQDRFLRPLFTCEEIWCQLFSEPGAGSDVAGLATRAVRDGDEWIVNGQKVWTTLAHMSKWGMLVARTNPDVPKHEGMTYFVLDMEAEGVEVRPLRQMTGEAEFNEVYMTDARIPDSLRVGAEGEGWRVAITTLMNERTALGGDSTVRRGGGPIHEAVKLWKARNHSDPVLKDRLMTLWVETEVQRLTSVRAAQMRAAGTPGPEGSTGKLATAELNQKVTEFFLDLLGADAMLYPPGYEMVRPSEVSLVSGADPRKAFLRARANTIEGGTSEIMRNILGERILGLPGDPRADKGVPWSDVPRN